MEWCEPWVTWEDVQQCCRADLSAVPVAQQQVIVEQATEILYALSGRRYPGVCQATRSVCVPCSCERRCCCPPCSRVDLSLRGLPVLAVTRVTLDGTDLASSSYRLEDARWLVRLDGAWPACVDLTDPAGFEVEWSYGRVPPVAGVQAAARLACEIASACIGTPCQLPRRVTTVQREGVTFTLIDSMQMLADGRTGVYDVDLWLASLRWADRVGGMLDPARDVLRMT